MGVEKCCRKLEISNLYNFIEGMDLVDVPIVGGIFT